MSPSMSETAWLGTSMVEQIELQKGASYLDTSSNAIDQHTDGDEHT